MMFLKLSKQLFMGLAIILMAGSCLTGVHVMAQMTTIHVQNFGATPGDGIDDLPGIQAAIDEAVAQGGNYRIQFATGVYELDQPWGDCLLIQDTPNLILEGAVDAQGNPATRFLRRHDYHLNGNYPKAILRVKNCDDFTLKNISFDNFPQFTSAATVVDKVGDQIMVEVLEGLPVVGNVRPYCSNLWDPTTKNLRQVASPTYGSDTEQNDLMWQTVPGGNGRYLSLTGEHLASKVEEGDLLSWHFGFKGIQINIDRCDRLTLDNLLTVNAIGFGISTSYCHDIQADKVVFKAEGNQLAVGSRDAWKLYGCDGDVVVDNMYVEGVRWDGQNVHGTFMLVKERVNDQTLVVYKRYTTFKPLTPGSRVSFWDGTQEVDRIVATCSEGEIKTDAPYTRAEATLTLTEVLPPFVTIDTLTSVHEWDIDSYTLQNSVFRNIAGCASILRNQTALFEGCTYEYIMYPAILLGASVPEGEGTFPKDVTIRDCIFRTSGWASRHSATGCLVVKTKGDGQFMDEVLIEDCTFEDADIGINIFDSNKVIMKSNTFNNINTHYQVAYPETAVLILGGPQQLIGPLQ